MKPLDSKGFANLGQFVDDDSEDLWEKNEDRSESLDERYQEKEFLASGALKNVFKVFDSKMKRYVALAELKEEIPEEEYETFINEARLTSALRHPNIITVHDFGFNEIHIPFFTMELKVGDTLGDIIKRGQKSLEALLEIFIKVCDAISYAHSEGVVHLDLKPDNIQVGEFGEVQVCDWGLSRKVGNLKTGEIIKGTPGFMAPEQIMPGEELDFKSDTFALGAILYSILTGLPPLEGGSKTAILSTIREEVTPPSERCPEKTIPESLNAVVVKAMAIDKDERYKSVEELKQELTNFLLGKSTNAENAGFVKEFSLFVKRNRQVCLLAFVSMVIFVASGFIFLLEIKKQQAETVEALQDLKTAHHELKASQEKEKSLFEQKEKTFKMFLQASREHEKMYNLLQGSELTHAYELMVNPIYFASPKQNLDKSLQILLAQNRQENPKPWINDLIIVNLFLSQKFKELQKYSSTKYGPLIIVAEKYQNTEFAPAGVLADKHFVELLTDLNNLPESAQNIKEEVFERLICFSLDARGIKFANSKIVRELIEAWNPGWNEESFIYKKSEERLKIFGENLKTLRSKEIYASQKSFLRFLRIDLLDISDSGINSLSNIEGAFVRRIDIRDTDVKNLHPHSATKSIEEVYLKPGQFDPDSKFVIPKSVRLVYKD